MTKKSSRADNVSDCLLTNNIRHLKRAVRQLALAEVSPYQP